MPQDKKGISKRRKTMHYSVGAVIKRDGKYLLIDRMHPPMGFAGVAGHIDEGETPEEALIREVKEESGLEVTMYKRLFSEELDFDWCNRGVTVHYWYLFLCSVKGEPILNGEECKSIGWYAPEEIKRLDIQMTWKYWFAKLNLLPEDGMDKKI